MSFPRHSLTPDIAKPNNPEIDQKIRQTIYKNPKYTGKLMRYQTQLTERILTEIEEQGLLENVSLQMLNINKYIADKLNEYAEMKDDELRQVAIGVLHRGDVRKAVRKHMAETQPAPPPPPSPPPPPPNIAIATMNPFVKRTTNK
jgi:hypothetical protein